MASASRKFIAPPVRLTCRFCGKPFQGATERSAWYKLASHTEDYHRKPVNMEALFDWFDEVDEYGNPVYVR